MLFYGKQILVEGLNKKIALGASDAFESLSILILFYMPNW